MKTAHSKKNASGEGEAKKRLEWVALVVKGESNPVNTKHLYNISTILDQRRRRWVDVVQMLCKCFVFIGKVESVRGNRGGENGGCCFVLPRYPAT